MDNDNYVGILKGSNWAQEKIVNTVILGVLGKFGFVTVLIHTKCLPTEILCGFSNLETPMLFYLNRFCALQAEISLRKTTKSHQERGVLKNQPQNQTNTRPDEEWSSLSAGPGPQICTSQLLSTNAKALNPPRRSRPQGPVPPSTPSSHLHPQTF
jgi:hypothetical protein